MTLDISRRGFRARRLLKLYYRDRNKVFKAIPGMSIGSTLLFLDNQEWTLKEYPHTTQFYVFQRWDKNED